jgi:hypothetical protein
MKKHIENINKKIAGVEDQGKINQIIRDYINYSPTVSVAQAKRLSKMIAVWS